MRVVRATGRMFHILWKAIEYANFRRQFIKKGVNCEEIELDRGLNRSTTALRSCANGVSLFFYSRSIYQLRYEVTGYP